MVRGALGSSVIQLLHVQIGMGVLVPDPLRHGRTDCALVQHLCRGS